MTLFLPLCKCNLIGRYAPFYAIVTHAHRNDTHLRTAQGLSTAHGLLTNDSLTVALMQFLSVTDLASNDPDFFSVPGLSVWRPYPTVDGRKDGEATAGSDKE
jgi:hypothetical protein